MIASKSIERTKKKKKIMTAWEEPPLHSDEEQDETGSRSKRSVDESESSIHSEEGQPFPPPKKSSLTKKPALPKKPSPKAPSPDGTGTFTATL